LGFRGSNDRSVVGVLKGLGFLSADGVPTARYNEFRDQTRSGAAMAAGLRDGWAPLFLSDEQVYLRSTGELKELFKNVTGKGEAVAEKLAATFRALAETASWSEQASVPLAEAEPAPVPVQLPAAAPAPAAGMRLHHDIHVHLPPTSDVAVYSAIFRALRAELLE
jgi:hypothetical protein